MTYPIADRFGLGIARRIRAQLTGWLLLVGLAASVPAADSVLLDFEGVGNNHLVGGYYGGEGGGPNYGIIFGTKALGIVDSDVVGDDGWLIANEPSPNTTVLIGGGDDDQAFVTALAGFKGMSFKYTSFSDVLVTVYDGPNMTGAVLGSSLMPPVGTCPHDCGDPTGYIGVWMSFAVPISGSAKSVGFSTDAKHPLYFDDMVIALVPPPPTKPPTKPPTISKSPTKVPTARACRRGVKGNKRCMMMKESP
jgi:hypothetical protein